MRRYDFDDEFLQQLIRPPLEFQALPFGQCGVQGRRGQLAEPLQFALSLVTHRELVGV